MTHWGVLSSGWFVLSLFGFILFCHTGPEFTDTPSDALHELRYLPATKE